MTAWRWIYLIFFTSVNLAASAQEQNSITVKVTAEPPQSLSRATVQLLEAIDSMLKKIQVTDSLGIVEFRNLAPGKYLLRVSHLGFTSHITGPISLENGQLLRLPVIVLQADRETLKAVTVMAHQPFIEMKPGKTVLNMDASISNAGATVLEALEKLPGISVDKDGNISLKGRSGVMVLIDGKQTFLNAAQLSDLLGGMNASQLSQVEIMNQPSSEFDAAGNAGIINLKMKKNTRRGFNGSMSTSFSQGFYPKDNTNLQMNYRGGAVNWFLNYGINASKGFTRIDALRTYFRPDGLILISQLDQASFLRNNATTQNLRTGLDYTFSKKTTLGIVLSAVSLSRRGRGNNSALWLNAVHQTDSLISTQSESKNGSKNGGLNLNLRHAVGSTGEFKADADLIGYRINGSQNFQNKGIVPSVYTETSKADLPKTIKILSARVDYIARPKDWILKAGAKISRIETDNLASYAYLDRDTWHEDLGRSNHFIYAENIRAAYANAETKSAKWTVQGGLRYEITHYDATQLGNTSVKDSSFSRNYNSLFPTALASYELDSVHTFSFSVGRRIDRPAFQELNPFLFIINKYTYQQGNPYYRPQYTWNMEVSHQYKDLLTASLNYSVAHDYFSQVFPVSRDGIVIYTVGNLKRLQTWGASVSVQLVPASWWSLSATANVIRKQMEGFIEKDYKATVVQGSFNMNNQLRLNKGWSAEVSGFYITKSRNDIQEVIDPAGQLTLGVAKSVLKNKGGVRLFARDIFYTQWMKGLTQFRMSNEYFKLTRDTRVVAVSLSYRFGKTFKTTSGSKGSAEEEMERAGNR